MTLRNEDHFYNAEANEPITRADGYSARIICRNRKAHSANPQKTIVALVKEPDGTEVPRTYFANGRFKESEKDDLDLVNMTLYRATANVYRSKKSGATVLTTEIKPQKEWELIGTKDIEIDVLL